MINYTVYITRNIGRNYVRQIAQKVQKLEKAGVNFVVTSMLSTMCLVGECDKVPDIVSSTHKITW